MVQDLVFAIDGVDARLSEPVRLRDAGPLTADSYTEWITQHPQLLGDHVRIVATDLRWNGDAFSDGAVIDVLGLDDDGRLVVGVVLVGDEPEDVLARALTQAAHASRLEPEELGDIHARHLQASGEHRGDAAAMQRLTAHAGGPLRVEQLARPRMVVFCEDVSAALGTTIVWLDEMGLDIALQRLRAYAIDRQTLLMVSRIFPSEPVSDLDVIRPRRPGMAAGSASGGHDRWGPDDDTGYVGGRHDAQHHMADHDAVDYESVDDDALDDDAVDYDAADAEHDVDHDDNGHHDTGHDAVGGQDDMAISGEPVYAGEPSDSDVVFTNGFGHGRQHEGP